MTYNELTEKFGVKGNEAFRVLASDIIARKLDGGEEADFRDVHVEDKLWYPFTGSLSSVFFEVKNVTPVVKQSSQYIDLELYEAYSDTTFNARLLYKKGTEVKALKFKKDQVVYWFLIPEAHITKEPHHPTIDEADLLDQVGSSWAFTLHPERIVDLVSELGKESSELIREENIQKFAYKDVYDESLYFFRNEDDDNELHHAFITSFKNAIQTLAKEKQKITVTIGGVEYVFANVEEARAVLGTNVGNTEK